jgi:hypothetical protein
MRIPSFYLKSMYRSESPANSFLQGIMQRNETFDLRVNDTRALSNYLVLAMNAAGKFVFHKIQFFLICCSRESYEMSHTGYSNCRRLETNVWTEYLDDIKVRKQESLLAYQWKELAKKTQNPPSSATPPTSQPATATVPSTQQPAAATIPNAQITPIYHFNALIKTKYEISTLLTLVIYLLLLLIITVFINLADRKISPIFDKKTAKPPNYQCPCCIKTESQTTGK